MLNKVCFGDLEWEDKELVPTLDLSNLSVLGDGREACELLLSDGDPALVAGGDELGEADAAVPGAVCAIKQLAEVPVLPPVLDVGGDDGDHPRCGAPASL